MDKTVRPKNAGNNISISFNHSTGPSTYPIKMQRCDICKDELIGHRIYTTDDNNSKVVVCKPCFKANYRRKSSLVKVRKFTFS